MILSPPQHLTAIAGGIGSGKSTVARILRTLGYPVYDCDIRAKAIMDESLEVRQLIAREVCSDALLPDMSLDRRALAAKVFADSEALSRLNQIVHQLVRDDLSRWVSSHAERELFVETAILYESELDRMVDAVWEVVAPDHVRIERVINRNGLSRRQVEERIEAQRSFVAGRRHPKVTVIVNDGVEPLLPQIIRALQL